MQGARMPSPGRDARSLWAKERWVFMVRDMHDPIRNNTL